MTMKENNNKFLAILSKILEVKKSEITDSMSPKTVPSWDSYNALMLVSELENAFKVRFSVEEIGGAKNIGDIKKNLRKNGVDL